LSGTPRALILSYSRTSRTACSTLAGSAASAAELSKIAKFSDIIVAVDFVPFADTQSGIAE